MPSSKHQTLTALKILHYVLRKEKLATQPGVAVIAEKAVTVSQEVYTTQNVPAQATTHYQAQPIITITSQDEQEVSLLWQNLADKVKVCQRCPLAQSRTQTVFGTGDKQAKLMLIGEAPGMNEDKQGLPFVGRAGQLLTQMLLAIGFTREDVYIANMIKCRPPNNRDPKPEEIASCADYLQQQVALVQPKLIVALGRIAAQGLLNVTTSLSRLRGIQHRYADGVTPMLVTYHPAYLLRNPADKRKALEDWLAIQQFLVR